MREIYPKTSNRASVLKLKDRHCALAARLAAADLELAIAQGRLHVARRHMERMYAHIRTRYALRVALQGDEK